MSLVLFQAAAVLALRTLAVAFARSPGDTSTSTLDAATDELVLELQHAVQRLARSGLSYTRIAGETGVGRTQLSLLMNHFDRAKRGERVLGEVALRGIRERLSAVPAARSR